MKHKAVVGVAAAALAVAVSVIGIDQASGTSVPGPSNMCSADFTAGIQYYGSAMEARSTVVNHGCTSVQAAIYSADPPVWYYGGWTSATSVAVLGGGTSWNQAGAFLALNGYATKRWYQTP